MQEIKFKPKEKLVMADLSKNGKITLDKSNWHLKSAVQDLWFINLVERDAQHHNVFNITALGTKALEWNNAVNVLK